MSGSHPNTFPKLHNAMWPGLVGKGSPGAEPTIDLDTMLDLTAAAEVDGIKFDGVDMFLYDPHINIDISDDDLKATADKIAAKGFVVGSVVAPVWFDASAMGDDQQREQLPDRHPQGVPDRQAAPRAGRPAVWRRPDRLGLLARPTGPRTPRATSRRSPRPSSRPRRSPAITASGSPPRARSAGAACTPGGRWSTCSSASASPRRSASRPTWRTRSSTRSARTRPRTGSCPKDYDWNDRETLDAALQDADRRAAALDDRLPRRPERRHRLRLGHARPHRPPLPGDRPQRQARHPPPRRLLAPRRERASSPRRSGTSAGTAACSPTPS